MADKQVTLTLKTIADISDVTQRAKDIQAALDKIQLPQKLKTNLETTFGNLYKEVDKASEAMRNGFKTKGDVTKYEKSINNINTLLERAYNTIHNIDSEKVTVQIDSKQLEEANKRINDLNRQLRTIATDKIKELDALFKQEGNPRDSKAASWGRFLDEMKKAEPDLAVMEKALNTLNRELDKHRDSNKQVESSYVEYEKRVQKMQDVYDILTGKSKEVINIQNDLNAAINSKNGLTMKAAEEGRQHLENASNAAQNLTQNVHLYGQETVTAAKETQRLGTELDQFKNRIAYFFGLNNAVRLLQRAFRSAYSTIKELDKALTETAVVTSYTVQDMWGKIPEYTERANKLGVTIQDVAEASTLYYQQGLKANEVTAVTTATLKMARIAGLDAAEATDRMTNALRGFNMEITESNADKVADVYSKLAAMSASNVDEISTAMTKVASLAHNANMSFETTSAFLSQIIETTRESAETAGTALKTVVARFSEVKQMFTKGELMGTDEEGEMIDVNKVSKALRTAGINLNEYLTGMKGLDDIFLELASKWDSLDNVQQRYIATMAAGSRQQSRFIAMMQDYKRTTELVTAANNASGASEEQYQKTLESLESKLNKLKNSWNEFITAIANQKIIKLVVDSLRTLLDIINKLTGKSGIAKLAVAFAGFKIGRNFIRNMFAGTRIGEMFMKKGSEAGLGFLSGLDKTLKGARSFNLSSFFIGNQAYKEQEAALTRLNVLQAEYIETSIAVDASTATERASRLALIDALTAQGLTEQSVIAVQKLGLSDQQIAILLTNKEITAKFNNIVATKGLESAEMKEFLAKELNNKIGQKGILIRLKENALRLASILGIKTEATAEELLIAKKEGDIAVTKLLEAVQKKALLTMGLYAAAAALLVVAFIAIINNTPAKQLEKATEKAKESAEKANDAAEAYENLKDSWRDLGDKYNNLDNLIKGTQDWRDALNEVNQEVLGLIEDFPKLAEFVYYDENGVLRIKAEGYERVKEASQQEVVDTAKQALEDKKNQLTIANRNALNKLSTSTNLTIGNTQDSALMRQQVLDAAAQGRQLTITELLLNNPNAFKNFRGEGKLAVENRERVQKALDEFYKSYEGNYGGLDTKLRNAVLEQGNFDVKNYNSIDDFLKKYHADETEGLEKYAQAFNELLESNNPYAKLISGDITQKEYKNLDIEDMPLSLGLTPSQIEDLKIEYDNIYKDFGNKTRRRNINGGWLNPQTNSKTIQNVFGQFDNMNSYDQSRVNKAVSAYYGQVGEEEGQNFLNLLFGSKWESIDSLDTLKTQLESLETTGDIDFQPLIELISEIRSAVTTIDPSKYASLTSFVNSINEKISKGENLSTEEVTRLRENYGASNNDFIQISEDEWIVNESSVTALKEKLEAAANKLLDNYIQTLERENTEDNQEKMAAVMQTAGYNASMQVEAKGDTYYQGAETSFNLTDASKDYIKYADEAAKSNEHLAKSYVSSANAASKLLPKFQELTDAIQDNVDELKKEDTSIKVLQKVATAANKAFGTDSIDSNFVAEHKQDFIDFAEGVEGSYKKISDALIEQNQDAINAIGDILGGENGLEGKFANLSNFIQGLDWDINGQAKLGDEEMLAAIGNDIDKANELREALLKAGIAMDITWDTQEYTGYDPIKGETFSYKVQTPKAVTFTNGLKQQEQINAKSGGRKSGGGGKQKYWDNPYDELYNKIEQQNELLRTREKLEREYDRILKNRGKSAKELLQNSLDEIKNLQKEIKVQEEIQAGRRRMINNLGTNGYYRNSEGQKKSFNQWGVTKYASYDYNTNQIKIDWAGIDKINDPDKGAAVEAYISKLEELTQSFEETQDQIEEMKDLIQEIKERNMQEYLDFEQRAYDAVLAREQKVIDEYSALSDVIDDSNSRILDGLRESIDLERQIRDNTKTEEDIADKEARLAYLRRDTSGANQTEIMKLEEELKNARESYGDTLVDQAIDNLEKENERASEQRQQQIKIMKAQLDWSEETGAFWEEIYDLFGNAFDEEGNVIEDSELFNLIRAAEGYRGMSKYGQQNFNNEGVQQAKQAYEGEYNWKQQSQGGSTSVEQPSTPTPTPTPITSAKGKIKGAGAVAPNYKTADVKKLQEGINDLIRDGKINLPLLDEDGKYGPKTTEAVRALQKLIGFTGSDVDGRWGKNSAAKFASSTFNQYEKGGLVNSTGLAWLDGTKSNPEMVLSARDTENFIALRNALTQMVAQGGGKGGDNYFDIQINVDELGSDYDVDQLASKIKKQIYDDSSYRNVNAISYLR